MFSQSQISNPHLNHKSKTQSNSSSERVNLTRKLFRLSKKLWYVIKLCLKIDDEIRAPRKRTIYPDIIFQRRTFENNGSGTSSVGRSLKPKTLIHKVWTPSPKPNIILRPNKIPQKKPINRQIGEYRAGKKYVEKLLEETRRQVWSILLCLADTQHSSIVLYFIERILSYSLHFYCYSIFQQN